MNVSLGQGEKAIFTFRPLKYHSKNTHILLSATKILLFPKSNKKMQAESEKQMK